MQQKRRELLSKNAAANDEDVLSASDDDHDEAVKNGDEKNSAVGVFWAVTPQPEFKKKGTCRKMKAA